MLLFVSNLVLFSQGRTLATTKLNPNIVVKAVEEKKASTKVQLGRSGFRFMEAGSVDAFSTPGHSPGIGHSKHD